MGVFNTAFAHLFRAVDRVKSQLETADPELRTYLAQELYSLRQLSEQYIDHWMELEERILELMDTYQLKQLTASDLSSSDTALHEGLDFSSLWNDLSAESGSSQSPGLGMTEAEQEPDVNLADAVFSWPDEATSQFRKGLAYYDLYMFDASRQALEEVLLRVDSPVVHLYLAAVLAVQGKSSQARSHLKVVFASEADERLVTAALEIEAQILLGNGELEKARQCYQRITAQMPEYLDAWYNLGLCDAKLANYPLAEKAFVRVLTEDPRDVEACLLLSSVQQQNRRLDDAYLTCRFGLDQSPGHLGIRLQQSRLLHQMGNTARSLELALRLADEDVHDQRILSWAVWLLLRTRQYESAIGRLKRYLALHRNHPTVLLQLGVTHLLMEDPSRAEPVLWAALPNADDKALLWLALGTVSASRGAHQEAQKRFLRAIRDPKPAVRRLALYQYALSLQAGEQFEEAQKYLHAAHVSGPPSAAILGALANNEEKLGRTQEAKRRRLQADHLASVTFSSELTKQDEL